MKIILDLQQRTAELIEAAAAKLEGFGDGFEPDVRLADPRHGDLQANGVLPWAKRNRQNPRQLAEQLLNELKAYPVDEVPWETLEIAGPGFINFKFSDEVLSGWVSEYVDSQKLERSISETLKGQHYIVDFSSPNTAKQMHVGHIRSTVIGDTISRLLAYCGAKVTRDNHIGDWGTQFGIIIMAIKRQDVDLTKLEGDKIQALENLYRQGNQLTEDDPTALDEARNELVKLQNGDAENTKLWEQIVEVSYEEFEKIYKMLGVQFDLVLGESYYRDKVDQIYEELEKAGISEISEGALIVLHPEHSRYAKQPFIIRKSDGASNYATTDLATALYRAEELKADKMVYVTDSRQKDHFEQLDLTVCKWFEKTERQMPELIHITFGTILGKDGKAIKTRSGESVKLKELLEEAVARAKDITREKNPDLVGSELDKVAQTVGIAAVKYADLSQNRSSDYQFDWDKMLAFEGNTAPYLLYVVARINGIFRKLPKPFAPADISSIAFTTDEERQLAKRLALFPVNLKLALDDLRPHQISAYLYDLCGDYNTFYHSNTVLTDDADRRQLRLTLCACTRQILTTGLDLLGIQALDKM